MAGFKGFFLSKGSSLLPFAARRVKRKEGSVQMLSAKGNEDTHPDAQGFESRVLKSNGMASGHLFPSKSKA